MVIAPKANKTATIASTGRRGRSARRVPAVTAGTTCMVEAAAVPVNAHNGRR